MNIHGLFGDCKECKLDTTDMRKMINSCDIMCFAETMNSKEIKVLYDGYEVINVTGVKLHKKGRASGGFMIYIRNELFHYSKVTVSKSKYWIWVEIKCSGNITAVGFVYIPPEESDSHKQRNTSLFEELQHEVLQLNESGAAVILLGDWNSRIGGISDDMDLEELNDPWPFTIPQRFNIDNGQNEFGYKLIQFCHNLNLRLLNGRFGENSNKWTHYNARGGSSVIDWAMTNQKLFTKVMSCSIGDENDFSDHTEILVMVDNIQFPHSENSISPTIKVQDVFQYGLGFKISHGMKSQFLQMLNSEEFQVQLTQISEDILQSDDMTVNVQKVTQFLAHLSGNIFEMKAAHTTKIQDIEQGFSHKRWYDEECRSQYLEKRKQGKQFGKNSQQYLQQSKNYKKVCSRKKKAFELSKSKELTSLRSKDPKAYWKLLKEGFNSSKVGNIKMEDWFSYFSQLFDGEMSPMSKNYDLQSIEELDKDFSIQELREAIFYTIKYHKASGSDGIANEILKWGMEWLQNILLTLFNQLYRKEIYPDTWNQVLLVPVFKDGSLNDPNNYRGIALLSCLGKPFCVMINKRLYKWAETQKYRPGKVNASD